MSFCNRCTKVLIQGMGLQFLINFWPVWIARFQVLFYFLLFKKNFNHRVKELPSLPMHLHCFCFDRIMRSREFGLDKRWLLMADLEQREKRRRNNLNGMAKQVWQDFFSCLCKKVLRAWSLQILTTTFLSYCTSKEDPKQDFELHLELNSNNSNKMSPKFIIYMNFNLKGFTPNTVAVTHCNSFGPRWILYNSLSKSLQYPIKNKHFLEPLNKRDYINHDYKKCCPLYMFILFLYQILRFFLKNMQY